MDCDSELFLLTDNRMHSKHFNSVLVIAIMKYTDNSCMIIFINSVNFPWQPVVIKYIKHIRKMFPVFIYFIIVAKAFLHTFQGTVYILMKCPFLCFNSASHSAYNINMYFTVDEILMKKCFIMPFKFILTYAPNCLPKVAF